MFCECFATLLLFAVPQNTWAEMGVWIPGRTTVCDGKNSVWFFIPWAALHPCSSDVFAFQLWHVDLRWVILACKFWAKLMPTVKPSLGWLWNQVLGDFFYSSPGDPVGLRSIIVVRSRQWRQCPSLPYEEQQVDQRSHRWWRVISYGFGRAACTFPTFQPACQTQVLRLYFWTRLQYNNVTIWHFTLKIVSWRSPSCWTLQSVTMQEAYLSEACHKNALQSDFSVTLRRLMPQEYMHTHMSFRGNLANLT